MIELEIRVIQILRTGDYFEPDRDAAPIFGDSRAAAFHRLIDDDVPSRVALKAARTVRRAADSATAHAGTWRARLNSMRSEKRLNAR